MTWLSDVNWWAQGVLCRVTRTEMTMYGWQAVPHCNGGSDIHTGCNLYTIPGLRGPMCDCRCRWCRVARRLRPGVIAKRSRV